jgi:hypothetical protein
MEGLAISLTFIHTFSGMSDAANVYTHPSVGEPVEPTRFSMVASTGSATDPAPMLSGTPSVGEPVEPTCFSSIADAHLPWFYLSSALTE